MNEQTNHFFKKDPVKNNQGGISLRNLLKKNVKNEKGLTLIELLAVIVILAIVALIAIPAIGNIISNSKSKAILSDASQIVASAKTAIADGACTEATNGSVTCTQEQLKDFYSDAKEKENTTYTVVKETAGYSVTYSEFANLNEKYKTKLGATDNKIGEKKLAETMGNK